VSGHTRESAAFSRRIVSFCAASIALSAASLSMSNHGTAINAGSASAPNDDPVKCGNNPGKVKDAL
jgi:hypothetical protein